MAFTRELIDVRHAQGKHYGFKIQLTTPSPKWIGYISVRDEPKVRLRAVQGFLEVVARSRGSAFPSAANIYPVDVSYPADDIWGRPVELEEGLKPSQPEIDELKREN